MKYINLDALKTAKIETEHFPYAIIPNFLKVEALQHLCDRFPSVPGPGNYPPDLLNIDPDFQALIDEMHHDTVRNIVTEKFDMDLTDRPSLMTIRGRSRMRDGKIHPGTASKLVTFLLHMNPNWPHESGNLRLLKDPDDINSTITEIRPEAGTLLIFKVSPNSWHGHKPFEGARRVIQMNYVTQQSVVHKALSRHRFSAKLKKFKKWVGLN